MKITLKVEYEGKEAEIHFEPNDIRGSVENEMNGLLNVRLIAKQ